MKSKSDERQLSTPKEDVKNPRRPNKTKGIPTSTKDEASPGIQHLKLPVSLTRVEINTADDLHIDQAHMTSVNRDPRVGEGG